MSNRVNTSRQSSNNNRTPIRINPNVGIVVDVILDESNPRVQKIDSKLVTTGKNTTIIGNCVIRPLGDQTSAESGLSHYPPLDALNLDIPLIGETVELVKVGNVSYYRRISRGFLNKGNAQENYNKDVFELTEPKQNTASGYSATSQTGISGTAGTDTRDTELGENYEENQVNNLTLNEADKIIQSRFGQSIRFSAYNNENGDYAPTILIRNRQNDVSLNELEIGDLVTEDVNRDGSTIALTSKDYQLDFQPGTVDDGGTTDFETKPDHFEDYPKDYTGIDQLLLNSDRILISSKSSEMIFYSKGNYGFISDGKMSIDNGKAGADLDFNGDVRLTTNDSNTYILGGKGEIYLNTESDEEPLARAQTLVDILGELIDEINAQIFATPSAPTSQGPTNRANFSKIKSKLDTIKSTLNFTE